MGRHGVSSVGKAGSPHGHFLGNVANEWREERNLLKATGAQGVWQHFLNAELVGGYFRMVWAWAWGRGHLQLGDFPRAQLCDMQPGTEARGGWESCPQVLSRLLSRIVHSSHCLTSCD